MPTVSYWYFYPAYIQKLKEFCRYHANSWYADFPVPAKFAALKFASGYPRDLFPGKELDLSKQTLNTIERGENHAGHDAGHAGHDAATI